MGETEGEPLATIGEIARQHGDISAVVPSREPGLFDTLIDELRSDVTDLVADRPYSAVLGALAVGFLGGLSIALSRRSRRYSRGW